MSRAGWLCAWFTANPVGLLGFAKKQRTPKDHNTSPFLLLNLYDLDNSRTSIQSSAGLLCSHVKVCPSGRPFARPRAIAHTGSRKASCRRLAAHCSVSSLSFECLLPGSPWLYFILSQTSFFQNLACPLNEIQSLTFKLHSLILPLLSSRPILCALYEVHENVCWINKSTQQKKFLRVYCMRWIQSSHRLIKWPTL